MEVIKEDEIKEEIKIEDIYISFYLFLGYIFTMSLMNKNPYLYYKTMIHTYIYDDNKYKSIFSKTYDYIYKKIIKT